jgi:hypothetical protein
MSTDVANLRNLIRTRCVRVANQKQHIDDGGGSFLQRIAQARQYKRLSKELYVVVKVSSG